ncbi:MAG: hypothetical protein QW379_01360 [Thermoplasmata archaeon]
MEAARICRLIAEGKGIRQIERLIGRHRDTIRGLIGAFLRNYHAGTRYLVSALKFNRPEVEAFWGMLAEMRKMPGKVQDKELARDEEVR